ncbi:ion channel [Acidobacteria bacterium AH-259-O06]|nr:ion channel [Acidobacteria bacterium AH-259-G07]MDA2930980.1 ion channel [Acidobacteria bacterium AH-259-O06]
MKTRLRRCYLFLRRENLHRLFLILGVLILLGAIGLAVFEPNTSLPSAIWWSVVTLTTVGYGDIAPATIGGRLIGILIMFLGIGVLALFSATLASVLVERKLKEERGMCSYDFENHIILCEWNHRAREILHELRADRRIETAPIVLIAEIDIKPIDDNNLFFIQGGVTEENLRRANLQKAETAIILGDDHLDARARDAKVVLSTLTVESINPNIYTIVELVDGANVQHCERANANEIIVITDFSSKLVSRATLDHGLSKVLSELLSSRFGNDLFKIPVPESMAGKTFMEIFAEMKRDHGNIVLAVQKGNEGEVISNPPVDCRLERTDHLIVIAPGRPQSRS